MKTCRRTKTMKMLFAVALLTLVPQIGATIPLDDIFRTFQTQMGVTNMSQDAFLTSLIDDVYGWVNYYVAGRDGVLPQELNAWYLSLTAATVPDGIDREGTNRWLLIKGDAVGFVSANSAVRDDTNCWFAVAREVGRIRAGFRNEHDWEVLEGIDQCEREVMPGGVVLISITNYNEYVVRSRIVSIMKNDQTRLENHAQDMVHAFEDFNRSQTFKNLSLPERNAIVSNLVETARMSELEMSALGFTNIVEQTGEP